MDQGKKCVGVFLDLKKAFDTISIPLLLIKLEELGIRGTTLDWFTDYLKNRSQTVRVESVTSKSNIITHGIPQGSTLGPTLFLTYMDKICKLVIKNGHIFSFADDTAILFHGSTWEEAHKMAEQGISKITRNLELNLLTVNASKTNYMCFSITRASQPPPDFELKLHTFPCNSTHRGQIPCSCEALEKASQIKYLGVTIDENLNWQAQISAVARRIRRLIHIFKNLRDVIDKESLCNVYTALCQSMLIYCIPVWGGAATTHMIALERAQRAIIKVMLQKPRKYSTEQLYVESQILTVRQMYILHTVLRHHMSHLSPISPEPKKRRKTNITLPRTKTTFARRQFYYLGPFLYRYINKKFKTTRQTKQALKNSMKIYLSKFNYEGTEKLLNTYSTQNII